MIPNDDHSVRRRSILNKKRGFFLTLEGGEGVGKTTLIRSLQTLATGSQADVVFTREPGGSLRAEALRKVLLSLDTEDPPMDPETEALIICAARSDHVRSVIRPSLARGALVVCDRFSDSTRAYQRLAFPQAQLEALIEFATAGLEPDLTILLDGDPGQFLERRKERSAGTDRFEARDLSFHQGVRDAFLRIAASNPHRFCIIDASGSPEEVLRNALDALEHKSGIRLEAKPGSS